MQRCEWCDIVYIYVDDSGLCVDCSDLRTKLSIPRKTKDWILRQQCEKLYREEWGHAPDEGPLPEFYVRVDEHEDITPYQKKRVLLALEKNDYTLSMSALKERFGIEESALRQLMIDACVWDLYKGTLKAW